jgi:hypothetical protein
VGSLAALIQRAAGSIKFARVDECHCVFPDNGEFRGGVAKPLKVLPQRQKFVGSSSEPFGDFLDRDLGCAEFFEHRTKRGDRHPLLLCDPRKFFLDNPSNAVLVKTVEFDVGAGRDAAAIRFDAWLRRGVSALPTNPIRHGITFASVWN